MQESNGHTLNGNMTKTNDKWTELHSSQKEFGVEFEKFYGFKPSRVDRRFNMTLSDMTYMPKVHHPPHIFQDES